MRTNFYKHYEAGRFNVDFVGDVYDENGRVFTMLLIDEFNDSDQPLRDRHLRYYVVLDDSLQESNIVKMFNESEVSELISSYPENSKIRIGLKLDMQIV